MLYNRYKLHADTTLPYYSINIKLSFLFTKLGAILKMYFQSEPGDAIKGAPPIGYSLDKTVRRIGLSKKKSNLRHSRKLKFQLLTFQTFTDKSYLNSSSDCSIDPCHRT
jgi:hypothetical protein